MDGDKVEHEDAETHFLNSRVGRSDFGDPLDCVILDRGSVNHRIHCTPHPKNGVTNRFISPLITELA